MDGMGFKDSSHLPFQQENGQVNAESYRECLGAGVLDVFGYRLHDL